MSDLLSPFFSGGDRVDTTEVFTELLYRIRKGGYQLSAEEAKALKKCENDLQVCFFFFSLSPFVSPFICHPCACGEA